MRLKRLLLVNYCQHARTEVHFHSGLTAIVGPNGIGKSNVVYGIKFALLGESDQDGVKADNIRDIAPPKEHAYVELDFSHGGVDYRILRKLRPESAKSEFWYGTTDKPILGDKDVTEAVLNALGVEKAAIQELMIVPQESMFGFLDRTQAKRLESWQRVLQLGVITRARQAIDRHLKLHPVQIGPDPQTIESARAATGEARTRLATAQAALAQFPDKAAMEAQINQLVQQDAAYQRYLLLKQQSDMAQQAAEASQQELRQAEESLQLLQTRPELLQPPQNTAVAQRKVSVLQMYLQMPQLPAQPGPVAMPEYIGRFPRLVELWQQADPARRTAVAELVTELQGKIRDEERFRQAYAAGVCGTCGQPVAKPEQLQEFDLEEAKRVLMGAQGFLAALTEQDRQQAAWQNSYQRVQGIREHTLASLAEFGLQDGPELQSQASSVIAQTQQMIQQLEAAARAYAEAQQNLARGQARVTAAQANWRQRSQEAVNAGAAHAAESGSVTGVPPGLIEQNRMWYQQRLDAEAAVTAAQTAVTVAENREADLQRLAAAAAGGSEWHDYADRLSSWLSPGGLPKLVMAAEAQKLVHGINSRLRLAGSDFTIEISPELEFLASFDDGRRQPDKRLSQGQKDLLGLTFRLALSDLTTEGLNALVIDEPTADLDSRYRDRVLNVIDHLRESAAGSGLQVVIVTHSKQLADRCDTVVDLTPGARA